MAHYADTSTYSQEERILWQQLQQLQTNTFHTARVFHTARGLEFTYHITGNELFIDRKEKSVTRSTVNMAYRKAREVMSTSGKITGPKQLKVFGASYLLPIFVELGICVKE